MKIYYDKEVDALYIELSNFKPDGTIEIEEGINIDTTEDGKIVGIEILDASQKINLKTILSYSLVISNEDLDRLSSKHEDKSVINTGIIGG